jgi:hypothetical protein
MHPKILIYESATATDRILAAAKALAERYELGDQAQALAVSHRDPEVERLEQLKAIAGFLEALALVEPGPRIGEILEIEGLSKTSIKAIMKHFHLEEADGNTE